MESAPDRMNGLGGVLPSRKAVRGEGFGLGPQARQRGEIGIVGFGDLLEPVFPVAGDLIQKRLPLGRQNLQRLGQIAVSAPRQKNA